MSDYDAGYRRGMFDKCNGREAFDLDAERNLDYVCGYLDGYVANERKT